MRAVAVLAKVPAPGAVKTRLVPALGVERATALARAMLLDTFEALDALDPTIARVFVAHGEPSLARALAPTNWRVVPQAEGDLGARIEGARAATGAQRAAIIGADSPVMSARRIEEALALLDRADVVVGPTSDGGYDLVAMSRSQPSILEAMPWSTEHLLAVTRARAAEAGLRLAELEVGFDVDVPEDVEGLLARLDAARAPAPRTRAWLAASPRSR